jgi:2-polyprenyl-3-methyl-5-hydroxy-6-metoxy-1,4-benzoquinol methylase
MGTEEEEPGAAGVQWHDDPSKDYRKRYFLPEHWVMSGDEPFSVDYTGYIQAVLSLLPTGGNGQRLLDAGCGDGFLSSRLAQLGFEVSGADYSQRAVAFAKMFVPNGDFHCLDLRDLNTRLQWQGAFDYAVSVEVLEHIPEENQLHVCRNLAGVLKDGGRLIISVPSKDMRGSYTHYKHFDLDEITELVQSVGFKVEAVVYQNRLSPLLSRRLWKILRNNYFDLVAVRRLIRTLWLRKYNIAGKDDKVGRFILACRKLPGSSPEGQ